ncbi:c6 zinc finger domain containing protein [Grosmannia clavigera kw1407]|uniref:C6 zinc finger domain containing protein n=1 Tax=Grosmannia clavigera (strain kw1407 / UAMH 11150) TaxID=655863 RepID=F0XHK5_GROCL|nr:c6 zinc finger domain containing protein [Grosmannia clavigera kw1407]EFX03292.1 c6 zinc finger domain containing protein [Grosmannia clavigera kw1407]
MSTPRTSRQPDDSHSKSEASPALSSATGVQEARQEQAPQEGHKRVYQACIPCRRRKVRCDLGSVDNPHDPPCVRCRRESKECYFSATRRKRKTDDDDDDNSNSNINRVDGSDYVIRNGRRKLHADETTGLPISRVLYNEVPLTPTSAGMSSQPLRRPTPDARAIASRKGMTAERRSVPAADESNTPLENLEARSVMRREVYGHHDALDLLYMAAESGKHATGPVLDSFGKGRGGETSTNNNLYDPGTGGGYGASRSGDAGGPRTEQLLDPTLSHNCSTGQPGYAEAVQLWARFRFVRAGWFTAQEAIEYIDYYYKYLSPLTPISPPTFNNPASHGTLLNEEPILAVTLLTVASRYKVLSGPGATCRSHAIHEQLWTYLRGMIERVVWGQEAFGGGFCGSGADEAQTSSTAPWRGLRKGSLRTLGTIESLMMLTEWHPRALHFPPAEVTDELLLPSQRTTEFQAAETADPRPVGVGGKRIDSWLEPAWRSDRMSWMLLSTAMGLAYELGVFDDLGEMLAAGAIMRPEYEEETYRLRANRIKRLILIYLTQLAGRLGWTSMVPESLRKKDPASSRRRPTSALDGQTPGTSLSSVSTAFNYIPDLELDDQIIHCWVGISNAMHAGNEKLFRSRKHTTEIIQTGSYIELLKDFRPLLRDWWTEFERFRLPTFIRHILTIEYEYVRIYVNSLSLQAVVERCTTKSAGGGSASSAAVGSAFGSSSAAPQLSPQTQNYYGKLPLGQLGGFGAADQEYVKEVVEGCRNLLTTVVDGLLPGGYLKHAPVRTYFRIISGAMFLLKTFALGAPKADVELSIALMDRTVDALRNCVVDDVHLGTRFADLLESLTSRLRNRFIHAPATMSADGRSPNPHYDAGSPAVTGHHGGHGPSALSSAMANSDLAWPKTGLSAMDRCNTPANISATPFDPAGGSFPYPSGMASTLGPTTPAASAAVDNSLGEHLFVDGADWNNNEMWYLPAGPAFFQNMGESNVAMTAEGVSIAGIDLLDFMTMDVPADLTSTMSGNGF